MRSGFNLPQAMFLIGRELGLVTRPWPERLRPWPSVRHPERSCAELFPLCADAFLAAESFEQSLEQMRIAAQATRGFLAVVLQVDHLLQRLRQFLTFDVLLGAD